jgi:hypothetical protein
MSAVDKKHLDMTPEEMELSRKIANKLREKQKRPRMLIARIVEAFGVEKAQEYFDRTLAIQHNGGLYMEDMNRRRTPGGVFFKLIKDEMDESQAKLFPSKQFTSRQEQLENSRNRHAPKFVWENRKEQLKEALKKREELKEVRIQIIGVPRNIEEFRDNVVLVMEHQEDLSHWTIPNGVPPLPKEPTIYTIYLGSLQWSKIKKKMNTPETSLVIEGIGAYDPEIPGIIVYATNATTSERKLKRPANKEKSENKQKEKDKDKDKEKEKNKKAKAQAKPVPKKKPAQAKKEKAATPPPPPKVEIEEIEVVIPDKAPAEVKQKLSELYKAAAQFQEKIKSIQSKPAGEQFGLGMTDKLLKNVQTQIKKLVDQYS